MVIPMISKASGQELLKKYANYQNNEKNNTITRMGTL